MEHYVYYSFEEFGRGYIGVRSCEGSASEDCYMGSYGDASFEPTSKVIIETFETREEAVAAEIALHAFFDVARNPHFANRSRQTSTGFDTTGMTWTLSEETRARQSAAQKRAAQIYPRVHHPISPEGRERIAASKRGKPRSEETKRKLSEAAKGRKLSEEHKAKLRASNQRAWTPEKRAEHSEKMKKALAQKREAERA